MIRNFSKDDNNKSGIYIIRSLIDDRFYIGSAIVFRKRFNSHKFAFNNIKSGCINTKLKNFVNKYGEDKLSFSVHEYCNIVNLLIREQYWIDKLKPSLNICKIAGNTLGRSCSDETKVLISNSNKGKIKRTTFSNDEIDNLIIRNRSLKMRNLISKANSKAVVQYDLNGKFLNHYKSATEAGIENKLSNKDISACCVNKRGAKRVSAYQWRYYQGIDADIDKYDSSKRGSKHIIWN